MPVSKSQTRNSRRTVNFKPRTKSSLGRNVLLAGGALFGLGFGAWRAGQTRFVPKVSGKLPLDGLHAPVEVVRDEWGVPHLYAQSEDDLFMAQGFVQAQDRFWQMEFQRRTAAGRLSEIFGPMVLPADQFLRRLELFREAEKSYEWIKQHENSLPLERFAAGVNAFLATKKLPVEISLLRYQPDPWQPADSLAWSNLLTFGQSSNFATELARAEVVRAAGPELAAKLEPWPTSGHPLIIPPDGSYEGADFGPILAEYERLASMLGIIRSGGSNNWVVSGAKSTTGLPILCNDPHPALQTPGVFYAMHLHAPDFEVSGAAVPGLPGVIVGHNQHIAWGVTNTMADSQDAFVEKLDPLNPRRYRYKGEWCEFEARYEDIKVKGQLTVRQEQFRSVHGPIISEFSPGGTVAADGGSVQGAPVAMAWSLYHQPFSLDGLLGVSRARNWPEFRAALKNCPFPSLNFGYADVEGNIGYQHTGLIPLRAKGIGLLPSPGDTGEYDWTGFLPFEELPQAFNPPQGFLLTANNKIVGDDYPYHLSGDYANGVRAERIRQLLTAHEKFAPDELNALFADVMCLTGLRLTRQLVRLEPTDNLERRALGLLALWDGQLTAASVPGCLYEVIMGKLLRLILEPQLGFAATNHNLGVGESDFSPVTSLYSLTGPHLLSFLERGDTSMLSPGLAWEEVLQEALTSAVKWLSQKLGEDLRGWEWGKLHQITHGHIIGSKQPFDKMFNRGPFPVGGDSDTIFQTAYAFKKDQYIANGGTPALRLMCDLSDWDNSRIAVSGGQSGSPFSPHYADLIEPWLNAQTHPMPFTRAALARHTASVLLLEPLAPSTIAGNGV